jgi:hypothetical protein
MNPCEPFLDMHKSMERLAHLLALSVELVRVSPGHFQSQLFPILAELGDAAENARSALESAIREEIGRSNVRAYAQVGEA